MRDRWPSRPPTSAARPVGHGGQGYGPDEEVPGLWWKGVVGFARSRPRVWTLRERVAGPARVLPPPKGRVALRAPTTRPTTETHVVDGVTAVETPVVRAIVGRLGSPRILQFAYFFGRAEPGPC